MRACVLDRSHSQGSPIAQLKSVPSVGEVCRCKLIQLQRIAGGEDQIIETAKFGKEGCNGSFVRDVGRLPCASPLIQSTAF
jgi:hypothetical protein